MSYRYVVPSCDDVVGVLPTDGDATLQLPRDTVGLSVLFLSAIVTIPYRRCTARLSRFCFSDQRMLTLSTSYDTGFTGLSQRGEDSRRSTPPLVVGCRTLKITSPRHNHLRVGLSETPPKLTWHPSRDPIRWKVSFPFALFIRADLDPMLTPDVSTRPGDVHKESIDAKGMCYQSPYVFSRCTPAFMPGR